MTTSLALRAADGREFPLVGSVRLGRAPESEIMLADDLASRLHARLWLESGTLLIRDEDSSNGTHLNGRLIERGQAYQLRPGDTVRVGGTSFTVVTASALAGRQPVAPPAAVPAAFTPAPTAIQARPRLSLGLLAGLMALGVLVCALVAVALGVGGFLYYRSSSGRPALSAGSTTFAKQTVTVAQADR